MVNNLQKKTKPKTTLEKIFDKFWIYGGEREKKFHHNRLEKNWNV